MSITFSGGDGVESWRDFKGRVSITHAPSRGRYTKIDSVVAKLAELGVIEVRRR